MVKKAFLVASDTVRHSRKMASDWAQVKSKTHRRAPQKEGHQTAPMTKEPTWGRDHKGTSEVQPCGDSAKEDDGWPPCSFSCPQVRWLCRGDHLQVDEGRAGAGPREVILQNGSSCWVENRLCEVPRGSRRPVHMAAVFQETDNGSRDWGVGGRTERRTQIQETYRMRNQQNKVMHCGGSIFPLGLWIPHAMTLVYFNFTYLPKLMLFFSCL